MQGYRAVAACPVLLPARTAGQLLWDALLPSTSDVTKQLFTVLSLHRPSLQGKTTAAVALTPDPTDGHTPAALASSIAVAQ